ncbi:hypothetical protein ACL6C3_14510 [Capilliphycus salinus ALCB114379]|uniref:hypothetical protein n=1 Tax=Capilliphycus salinus TaxID=2768948 RepID=UPI0039A48266
MEVPLKQFGSVRFSVGKKFRIIFAEEFHFERLMIGDRTEAANFLTDMGFSTICINGSFVGESSPRWRGE